MAGLRYLMALLGVSLSAVAFTTVAEEHQPDKARSGPLDTRALQPEPMDERREGSDDLGGRERQSYPSTTLEPGQTPEVPGSFGGLGDGPETEAEETQ